MKGYFAWLSAGVGKLFAVVIATIIAVAFLALLAACCGIIVYLAVGIWKGVMAL